MLRLIRKNKKSGKIMEFYFFITVLIAQLMSMKKHLKPMLKREFRRYMLQ